MASVYAACAVHVAIIFSTGDRFLSVLELHALTLAARSYALLPHAGIVHNFQAKGHAVTPVDLWECT